MITKLGRYELKEEIGQGAFAVVYRAWDAALEREVALKRMKPGFLPDADWVRRFYREARTVARLEHPHIVTVYDMGEADGQIFIVMRLVRGSSLDRQLAAAGRLPWPQVVGIIEAVAGALDYAHGQNVLHRDLKPANILLDAKLGPMLTDFGLAKLAGESASSVTSAGGFVGTAQYIAPEVWEGQGSTRRSDIYALGCILFELLTGAPMFGGDTPPAVMMSHFRPPQLPGVWPVDVPPQISEVLSRALARDPAHRFATARELAQALLPVAAAPRRRPAVDSGQDSASLRLHLFGAPRLETAGQPAELRGRKLTALAAYLAVTRQTHSRDAVATMFWPEHDQSAARANLRRELSRLNKVLGEGQIASDRESVGLAAAAGLWLDVEEFQRRLLDCGQTVADSPCAACLPSLTGAVELYAADFLAGFSLPDSPEFDEWQFFQTESLRRRLAEALEKLARCHAARHEFDPATEFARRRLNLDVLHEPAHRLLMQLYAQSGQRSAALRQFDACARALADELGASPEEETRALAARIRAGESEFLPVPAADEQLPQVESAVRHSLRAPLTPLVGRQAELAQLTDLLTGPAGRLVTLFGPAGIGKSHLAQAAAAQQVENFAHGACFVGLSSLESAEQLLPAVTRALNIPLDAGTPPDQQLADYLRGKELLLLLDNFEHLQAGAGSLVTLLQAAPGLKILVTSQMRLNAPNEQLLPLSGLSAPSADGENPQQSEAVSLFLESARRVRPEFEPDSAGWRAIADICRQVQGMPLAILLAASWVNVLSPPEILAEIEQNADFLETDAPHVPLRQRSIRAVFDAAWQRLSPAEQKVFARLSIFRAGFSRDAAQTVAGASLRDLMGLVNKSLLFRTAEGRYQVHSLLRQYAAEKQAARRVGSQSLQAQFGEYFLRQLQQRTVDLRGRRQQAALAAIATDIENIRAAWNWAAAARRTDLLAQAVDSLFHFFDMRSWFREGAAAFQRAADSLAEDAGAAEIRSLQGKFLARLGWFQFQLGQVGVAEEHLQRSLLLLREAGDAGRRELPFSLNYLGAVQGHLGHFAPAEQNLAESVALCRELGDQFGLAIAFNVWGQAAYAQGEYTAAREHFRKSLNLARMLEHRWGIAFSLTNLGRVSVALADDSAARQLFEESLKIRRELNDRRGIAMGLNDLGEVALAAGDDTAAVRFHRESLTLFEEIGNRWGQARSLIYLGDVAAQQSDAAAARETYGQAVQLARKIEAIPLVLNVLVGMAGLLVQTGEHRRALEILSVVINHPNVGRSDQNRAARWLVDLSSADLSPEMIAAARQTGKSRSLDELVADLLF